MTSDALTQMLTRILKEFPEINLVYLFGSQVTGNVGPLSDYDFAILVDPSADPNQVQAKFQHTLTLALNTPKIDVILLSFVPIELAYQVIARGKLLFRRDIHTHIDFEARILGLYGDYLPVLRSQRTQILKGGQDGKRIHRYRETLGRTQRTISAVTSVKRKRTRRV